jgi:glucose-6-phosphate-specific signal transduction histidine kinase
VTINTIGNELRLVVEDNGRGLKGSQGRGLGVIAMRERAQAQGGAFSIQAPALGGTRVVVTMTVATGELAAVKDVRAAVTGGVPYGARPNPSR